MNRKEIAKNLATLKSSILSQQEKAILEKPILCFFLTLFLVSLLCTISTLVCMIIGLTKNDVLLAIFAGVWPLIFFIIMLSLIVVNYNYSKKLGVAAATLQLKYNLFLSHKRNKTIALYTLLRHAQLNKSDDKAILESLVNNKNLLHRLYVPIFRLLIDANISPITAASLIREAYSFATCDVQDLTNLSKYISKCKVQETIDMVIDCYWQKTTMPGYKYSMDFNDVLLLVSNDGAPLIETFNNFFCACNTSLVTKLYFLCSQTKIALIKAFRFGKELRTIIDNSELLTILTNAYLEKHDSIEVADATYEIFLEYYNMSSTQFPLTEYAELLSILFNSILDCHGFYSSDEIDSTINVSLPFTDICKQLEESKSYNKYDIDKIILSIIYEKINDYTTIDELISDLLKISEYRQKLIKAKTKDNLLNGLISYQKKTITDIDLMSGNEFEEFLREYFIGLGYRCRLTKATGDQGIDLVASKDDTVIAIQAKCYSGTVGNHAIMEAVAGTKYYKATRTMVITNSTFTKSAIELAKANNVILWDRKILIEKML